MRKFLLTAGTCAGRKGPSYSFAIQRSKISKKVKKYVESGECSLCLCKRKKCNQFYIRCDAEVRVGFANLIRPGGAPYQIAPAKAKSTRYRGIDNVAVVNLDFRRL
jgi:hypothetical protein